MTRVADFFHSTSFLGQLFEAVVELSGDISPPTLESLNATNKASPIWEACLGQLISNQPSYTDTFYTCLGIRSITSKLNLHNPSAISEKVASFAKLAVQAAALNLINQTRLPSLPVLNQTLSLQHNVTQGIAPTESDPTGTINMAALSGFALIQPFITNRLYGKDSLIASSINKGLATGAFMAWAFGLNLNLGAFTGCLSALPVDLAMDYTLKPTFTLINNLRNNAQMQNTAYTLSTLAQYFITATCLLTCYSALDQLTQTIPFLNDSPYTSFALGIPTILVAGAARYALSIPFSIVKGITENSAELIGTVLSLPQIPLIAYTSTYASLFLTRHQEPIQHFTSEILSYDKYLTIYNNTSSELLQHWDKVQNFDPCETPTRALWTLSILNILAGSLGIASYRHLRH